MDKQNQCVHTMRYYTIIKKNCLLTGVTICIEHENIILGKYISFLKLHIILFHCKGFYRTLYRDSSKTSSYQSLNMGK